MENKTLIVRKNIIHNLNLIPAEKLQEVDTYVKFILFQTGKNNLPDTENIETLSGIWEGLGFEKTINLDDEIDSLRNELGKSILNKEM